MATPAGIEQLDFFEFLKRSSYLVTFNVTVFEVALPFLGTTVTVTLQDPDLRPLTTAPDTLQFLTELRTTFSDTFEAGNSFSFAKTAIDLADADLEVLIRGVITVRTADGDNTGVAATAFAIGSVAIGALEIDGVELEPTICRVLFSAMAAENASFPGCLIVILQVPIDKGKSW